MSALLTVKSNMDPHMIIKLKDGELNRGPMSFNGLLKWFHLSILRCNHYAHDELGFWDTLTISKVGVVNKILTN
jgi:hypothetical protein